MSVSNPGDHFEVTPMKAFWGIKLFHGPVSPIKDNSMIAE
jgi:hypothetical protein